MPRFTIYVSDALRAEMSEVEDVNWSAVAQASFEEEVARRRADAEEQLDMALATRRLKAAKRRLEREEITNANAAGARWAALHASYRELLNLVEHSSRPTVEPRDYDPTRVFWVMKRMAKDEPEALDFEDSSKEFWRIWSTSDNPSNEYVMNFVTGALELFSQLRDDL